MFVSSQQRRARGKEVKEEKSYEVTCHIGPPSLLANRHKWTHPTLTPARQAGTWFEGWKAELTWVTGYMPRPIYERVGLILNKRKTI